MAEEEREIPDYPAFIEMLKHASCLGFVTKLQNFSEKFPTEISRDQASELFLAFLFRAEQKLMSLEIFSSLANKLQISDHLEKFVLKLLEGKLAQPEDGVLDKVLFEKMTGMAERIELGKHLKGPEIGNLDRSIIDLAINELKALENYRAPKDKLQCFVNAHKILKYALEMTRNPWGAEELFPLIIYVVIQARPRRLVSDVKLIRHFSKPGRLQGEIDYAFTQLEMACEFIASFDIRILKRLSEPLKQQIDHLAITLIDKQVLTMLDLPTLIEEAQLMDATLTAAGFETDLDLTAMKIDQIYDLLKWYLNTAQFIRKLQNIA